MIRLLCTLLALCFASQTFAQTARPLADLPLVAANTLSPQEHVIFTVPLSDEALLDAAAENLGEEYGVVLTAIWPLAAVDVVCYVFAVLPGGSVDALLTAAAQDPRIVTASEVKVFTPLTSTYADDLVPQQYALAEMDALDAHDISTGAQVKVAVIDSGVATDHSDLANQAITFRDFVRPKAKDAVGEPHGTAMAALIVADARNARGMVGVAPDVELLALRACWSVDTTGERCNSFSLARALNVAIGAKVDIINLSLGGPEDPLLALLIDRAVRNDIVVVAARGSKQEPLFPASHPGVFAAAATSNADVPGITAPGLEVLSAKPNGHFDFFTGDSVATAHVSGVAALVLSANGNGTIPKVARLRALFAQTPGAVNACAFLAASAQAACPAD